MSVLRRPAPTGDEMGMSLVEVIIYSALTALVLSILGGLFFVGFQTQADAVGRDAATGAAQVVSNSLQTSVRNASSVSVDSTHTLLTARVATGDADAVAAEDQGAWQCVAWKLTDDHKLVYKTSLDGAITAIDYSNWTALGTRASGPLVGDAFAVDAKRVTYSLVFSYGENRTVPVAGVVAANAEGIGSPASC